MDQVTAAAVQRSRESHESPADKVARNLERHLTAGSTPAAHAAQPSLPSSDQVELITLTLDELHDLVYLAASSVNQGSTTMSKSHAQDLAKRAAMLARSRAARHDGHHRGADPRG